ncbi:hypothetical protein SGUI_2458 [Serinicoccus hydrothermalis]|uniref:Ribbon-helix-helix protein CopG domain-containing protein n=1 Tax=Serinicoccus hydrothermalis TaxID=1758689 RepID=A0A1B1NEJ4_9MICO|nr:hypothetical protein SGUI_2458 [Serinicoccus hydrothermalis]
MLDQQRYAAVAGEAERSGRSVAAVIRNAIDVYLDPDVAVRQAGLDRFLGFTPDENGSDTWEDTRALLEADPLTEVP